MDLYERTVVDRIVDGQHAVLLVGQQEEERVVPVADLPAGAGEGAWMKVRFEGGELVEAIVDIKETDQVRQRISSKTNLLRKRGRAKG